MPDFSALRSLARRFEAVWLSGSLALYTFVCYRGMLHNSFLAEDLWQSQIWHDPIWMRRAFYPGAGGYRPLMFIFWAVTSPLWGDHPFAYRMLVLSLHLFNACAVFSIARTITRRTALSLLAGLLFVSFDSSAETINWLSAASNQIVSLVGFLIALRAFIALSRRPPSHDARRRRNFVLCVVGLLIGLSACEMALTWPVVALLFAAMARLHGLKHSWHGPARRARWLSSGTVGWLKDTLVAWRPLVVVWVGFVILRTIMVRGIGGYGASVHLRAGWFLIGYLNTFARYFFTPWATLLRVVDASNLVGLLTDQHRIITSLLLITGGTLAGLPSLPALAAAFVLLLPAWNIPALHRAYFMGIGVALVVAMTCSFWLHQLSRYRFKRVGQAGLALLAGFLLAAQLRGAGTRNELWVNAGNWSEKVLSATSAIVPKPADRTTFYYLDLPQTHDGIYVFTWGLREAVQKHYRNLTLDAYQVYPTADPLRVSRQLEAPLDDLGSLDGSPHVFLVYRLDRDGLPLLEQVSLEEFVIAARSAIP